MKKLRLSKALTIPEGTTVSDACRRMAARRVTAVLLTDANALLSGICTDKVTSADPFLFLLVLFFSFLHSATGHFCVVFLHHVFFGLLGYCC